MRIAIKIGYDGSLFDGFAMQPNKKTVEGEILKRLRKSKIIKDRKKDRFQYASRTDKGVSAFGNVIAFNSKGNAIKVLEGMEGIWIFGYKFVSENFNPKRCKSKIYRYYLYDDGYDIEKLNKCAKLFEGEHNFSNFARLDGRNPVRKIDKVRVIKEGEIIKIDFIGKSFLWNQIRRMVSAMIKVGKNEADVNDVKKALYCKEKKNFGVAPAQNLVLYDIKYDFEFEKVLPREILIKRCMMNDAIEINKY